MLTSDGITFPLDSPERTIFLLRERVKELSALHHTAKLLQDQTRSPGEVMADVVALLPSAWQYPECASACITFGSLKVSTPGFKPTPAKQSATFTARNDMEGVITVCYSEEKPVLDEGPFLKEERELIESLAEILRAYFQHLLADEELEKARAELEQQVEARTKDLRMLTAELSLSEARERRELASDLHDQIIQQFAIIKLHIQRFRGDAVFCGFGGYDDYHLWSIYADYVVKRDNPSLSRQRFNILALFLE